MESKIITTLKSGMVATAMMTMVIFMAPYMGLPKMPVWLWLADFGQMPLIFGWVAHFMIGIILAGIYVVAFRDWLPGPAIVKGAGYALFPFLAAQTIVMPLIGPGVFSINNPSILPMIGNLTGHLIYGMVLGFVASREKAKDIDSAEIDY